MMNLTLDYGNETQAMPNGVQNVATTRENSDVATYSYESMTPEERKMIDDFVKKIDLDNSQQVLHYGAVAQQNISNFSAQALGNVRTKDLGEVGEQLTSLVVQLESLDKPQAKKGLFGKVRTNLTEMKTQYTSAEGNVEKISKVLQNHAHILSADITTYDKLYDLNMNYFKELSYYIIAGKRKIAEAREGKLAELHQKAINSGNAVDAQLCNDFAKLVDRFEKKINDLELTRHICLQMGMQIRMSQDSNEVMVEKIQTTLLNTIPLWRSQMVLAFGLEHSRQAAIAQKSVSDLTNNLLKSNAQIMKTGTILIATEAERGIVEIETLVETNETLISTLDEVKNIHIEGKKKRAEAEKELIKLEQQLKNKLLEEISVQ